MNIKDDILELIQSSTETSTYTLSPTSGDYVRLSLYNENDIFIGYYYSNLSAEDDTPIIYSADVDDITATCTGLEFMAEDDISPGGVPGETGLWLTAEQYLAKHTDQDFTSYDCNSDFTDVDFGSLSEMRVVCEDDSTVTLCDSEGTWCNWGTGPGGDSDYYYSSGAEACATITTEIVGIPDTQEGWTITDSGGTPTEPQIKIYKTLEGKIFVKPSEILDKNDIPEGNYRLQFDFLRDALIETSGSIVAEGQDASVLDTAYHTITEISPSRKEVRLVLKNGIDDTFDQKSFQHSIGDKLLKEYYGDTFLLAPNLTPDTSYKYKHVLNITRGRNILITNQEFDDKTIDNNTSLILRLHESLPVDIPLYSKVSINRELIQQQTQDIFYVSNVKGVVVSSALTPDIESFAEITNDQTTDTYQDYDDLYESSSIDNNATDIISSSMSDPDINLNINFSKFENHVFFGSATSKLENFKTKVSEIEDYLTSISHSFGRSGSHIYDRRKELFNKIQNIKTNFTPYEKFMYNDNQYTETSSAPGIGKNLAEQVPVELSSNNPRNEVLSNYEGFKVVYKHTDQGSKQKWIPIFSNKYFVQNAPYFNYSGSIYLSFILRGPGNIDGETADGQLVWNNSNQHNYGNINGLYLPQDAFSKKKLINPTFTESVYRRHVYVASQSWWRPTQYAGSSSASPIPTHTPYNTVSMSFKGRSKMAALPEYQILSGSMIPTGAKNDRHPIAVHADYSTYPGAYSGSTIVPHQKFSGSIMPMGELFRTHWVSGSAREISKIIVGSMSRGDSGRGVPNGMHFDFNAPTNGNFKIGIVSESAGISQTVPNPDGRQLFYYKFNGATATTKSIVGGVRDLINRPESSSLSTLFSASVLTNNEGSKLFITSSRPGGVTAIVGYGSGSSTTASISLVAATGSVSVTSQGATTSSFTTDVKITLKDPTETLPFGQLYSTGSTKWTNWYNGMYDSASAYDDNNIHSLANNLPDHIREDIESDDLKTFIRMIGEHFDLLRNYIDNYSNLYKRKYKQNESVPPNLLPMLTDNLGWEVINPFSSSLASYFSDWSYDDNIQEIGNATWRKILNNLIYIYKSKGTHNSVRALLNIYGYPPDFLQLKEYGGSTEEHNPTIITDDALTLTSGLGGSSGNVSYILEKKEFYAIDLTGKDRKLYFDYNTNSAEGRGIEFVFSARETANNQTLIENSGSGLEKLWDIIIIPSSSGGTKDKTIGKLQFRLHNKFIPTSSIVGNAVSMSTGYYDFNNPSKMWNVFLTKVSASKSPSLVHEYKLHVGRSDKDKIPDFEIISMSISSSATDGNYYANRNYIGTGSLDITSSAAVSGNLVFGQTFSGSIGEVRLWSGSLSASKFKQHVLNPFSVVGNTQNFSRNNLVWHYKLRENPDFVDSTEVSRGTIKSSLFKDANPRGPVVNPKSYDVSHSIFNDGHLYIKKIIDVAKLSTRIGGDIVQRNDNKIYIDNGETFVRDLSPIHTSVRSLYDGQNKTGTKRKISNKIDLANSLQDSVDDYIINNLADFNLGNRFGSPHSMMYSASHVDLDDYRKDLLQDVSIDANKWIDSQKNIFNNNLVKGVKSLFPARSSNESVGVIIKQNILERSKYQYHPLSIDTGSAAGIYQGTLLNYWTDIDISSASGSKVHNLSQSAYIQPYGIDDEINFSNTVYNLSSSEYIQPYTSSIKFIDDYINLTQSSFVQTYSSSVKYIDDYMNLTQSSFVQPYTSSIKFIDTYMNLTQSAFVQPYSSSIVNIIDSYMNLTQSSFVQPYTSSIKFIDTYMNLTQSSLVLPYSSSIKYIDNYMNLTQSEYIPVYTSSIKFIDDYINLTQSEYVPAYTSSIIKPIDDYLTFTSSKFVPFYSSSTDIIDEVISQSMSYISTYVMNTINIPTGSIDLTNSSYTPTKDGHIGIINSGSVLNLTGSMYVPFYSASVDYVENYVNFTQSSYVPPYSSSTNMVDNYLSLTQSSFVSEYTASVKFIDDYINFTESSYNPEYSSSLSITSDMISLTGSNLPVYTSSIYYVDTYINMSQSYVSPYTGSNIKIVDSYMNLSHSAYAVPYSASNNESANYNYFGQGLDIQGVPYPNSSDGTTRTRLVDTWGTSSDHTHFIHFGRPGVYYDYNTYYYNPDYIIHSIGDKEILSSSRDRHGEVYIEWDNHKSHFNRLNVDGGKGYSYKSYVGTGSELSTGAPIDGRPMGRTSYFTTSSDGTLIYPANHYVNVGTSKQSIEHLIYKGSLCGENVQVIDRKTGDIVSGTLGANEDPLHLVNTASCVDVKRVLGADTDNVLKVVRN